MCVSHWIFSVCIWLSRWGEYKQVVFTEQRIHERKDIDFGRHHLYGAGRLSIDNNTQAQLLWLVSNELVQLDDRRTSTISFWWSNDLVMREDAPKKNTCLPLPVRGSTHTITICLKSDIYFPFDTQNLRECAKSQPPDIISLSSTGNMYELR